MIFQQSKNGMINIFYVNKNIYILKKHKINKNE